MEELNEICEMVLDVEEGLMFGSINFSYSNLMCAMKAGHPMEILDSILAEIFWDVKNDKEPSKEQLKTTLQNFKDFKEEFKVKEMNKPIKALEAYIKAQKE